MIIRLTIFITLFTNIVAMANPHMGIPSLSIEDFPKKEQVIASLIKRAFEKIDVTSKNPVAIKGIRVRLLIIYHTLEQAKGDCAKVDVKALAAQLKYCRQREKQGFPSSDSFLAGFVAKKITFFHRPEKEESEKGKPT